MAKKSPTRSVAARSKLPCGRPLAEGHPTISGEGLEKTWKDRLEAYYASKELNQSEARNKLIELVLQQTGHFTIQELIRRLAQREPQMGTATVYRNIPILIDAGILKETLTDESGQKFYEVAEEGHHDHIVCVDCHHIFEFHDEKIEKAQDSVTSALRFTPVKHTHVIFAKCGYKKHKA